MLSQLQMRNTKWTARNFVKKVFPIDGKNQMFERRDYATLKAEITKKTIKFLKIR